MTFDEYAEQELWALTGEAKRLVNMGWNARGKFGDEWRAPCDSQNAESDTQSGLSCTGGVQGGGEAVAYEYWWKDSPRIKSVDKAARVPVGAEGLICRPLVYGDAHPSASVPDGWIYEAPQDAFGDHRDEVWTLDELGGIELMDIDDARAEWRSSDVGIIAWQPTNLKRPAPPEGAKR